MSLATLRGFGNSWVFLLGITLGLPESAPGSDPFISTLQPAALTYLPVLIQVESETQPSSQGTGQDMGLPGQH